MFRPAEITNTVTRAAKDAGLSWWESRPWRTRRSWNIFHSGLRKGARGEMKYLEARDEQGRLKRGVAGVCGSVGAKCGGVRHQLQHGAAVLDGDSDSVEENRERGWISRYAWSQQDYHDLAMQRLRRVEAAVRNAAASDDVVTRLLC